MRQHLLDNKELFREIDSGDQAIAVPTDIENEPSTLPSDIGGGESLPHSRQMLPVRVPDDGQKTLERLAGRGMLARELARIRFTKDPHL